VVRQHRYRVRQPLHETHGAAPNSGENPVTSDYQAPLPAAHSDLFTPTFGSHEIPESLAFCTKFASLNSYDTQCAGITGAPRALQARVRRTESARGGSGPALVTLGLEAPASTANGRNKRICLCGARRLFAKMTEFSGAADSSTRRVRRARTRSARAPHDCSVSRPCFVTDRARSPAAPRGVSPVPCV
jgi:hypothetical protein